MNRMVATMASGVDDNRPDVELRMKARYVPAGWEYLVTGEAKCRFGCGGMLSSDVRQLVHWADEHEKSDSHKLAKEEWMRKESVHGS